MNKGMKKRTENFDKTMKSQMNAFEYKKKMKDVNLAFFPTLVQDEYYVIVCNFIKANALILDNKSDGENIEKYKDVFELVKTLLLKYLTKMAHPCVGKLSRDKTPKVYKLKWRTKKNKVDSGLYTILHLELYDGDSASKWRPEIVVETNRDHDIQMRTMRSRSATKIVMHEMNTKRRLMSDYANKFEEKRKVAATLQKK
ncbi:hypothetical protein Tco_0134150 [Tanacetum coccineum]